MLIIWKTGKIIVEEKFEYSGDNYTNVDIWSAGGVVVRKKNNQTEVLICERFSENLIALPKGKPNEGEYEAATAIREVREETGINAIIKNKIKDIFYTFESPNGIINKKVSFFLMEKIDGEISNHDDEFDKVYWEKWDSALNKLSYQEKRMYWKKLLNWPKTAEKSKKFLIEGKKN